MKGAVALFPIGGCFHGVRVIILSMLVTGALVMVGAWNIVVFVDDLVISFVSVCAICAWWQSCHCWFLCWCIVGGLAYCDLASSGAVSELSVSLPMSSSSLNISFYRMVLDVVVVLLVVLALLVL